MLTFIINVVKYLFIGKGHIKVIYMNEKKHKNLTDNTLKKEVKKSWELLKSGTKNMFKEIRNKKTFKKQIANILTIIRIIIPIVTLILSIIALHASIIPLFIICGVLAAIGGVTDLFDGMISRKTNSSSEYGKLLDQISDKEFAGVIGLNLLFINHNYLAVLLGEAIIAAINVFYKSKYKDLDMTSTKAGKFKMVPLFLTLILGYFAPINSSLMLISNVSILITVIMQIITAGSYIIQNKDGVKKIQEKKLNELLENENNRQKENRKSLEFTKKIDNNNKNISQIEELKNLKNALNQIIISDNDNEKTDSSFQKKKIKTDHFN